MIDDHFEYELSRIEAEAQVARFDRLWRRLVRLDIVLAVLAPMFFSGAIFQHGLMGSGGQTLVLLGILFLVCAFVLLMVLAFMDDERPRAR